MEEIDLEEYTDKFEQIGAQKAKHLRDLTEHDLNSIIGLRELEVRRFQKKASQIAGKITSPDSTKPSVCVSEKVCFPLPHPSFGHSVTSASEDQLRKEYKELYFNAPEGLKQRMINSYILGMCAAARWRFQSKRDLFEWARRERERDMRWTMALTFMETEKM